MSDGSMGASAGEIICHFRGGYFFQQVLIIRL